MVVQVAADLDVSQSAASRFSTGSTTYNCPTMRIPTAHTAPTVRPTGAHGSVSAGALMSARPGRGQEEAAR
ncbi:hypothetical protein ACFV4K_26650 [Nocardia sp. NPDC059764]|uniref:hypothetical protein n=1 Tax=Nocardia sp. NPDC059764 TaxID=3346939 RepID=UPI0036584C76